MLLSSSSFFLSLIPNFIYDLLLLLLVQLLPFSNQPIYSFLPSQEILYCPHQVVLVVVVVVDHSAAYLQLILQQEEVLLSQEGIMRMIPLITAIRSFPLSLSIFLLNTLRQLFHLLLLQNHHHCCSHSLKRTNSILHFLRNSSSSSSSSCSSSSSIIVVLLLTPFSSITLPSSCINPFLLSL